MRDAAEVTERALVYLLIFFFQAEDGIRDSALERDEVGFSSAAAGQVEAGAPDLERADRLAERLAERAADRHRFTDGLHLRAEQRRRRRELLEREPRPLDDDVVDRRLERGRPDLGDVVLELA